MHSTNTLKRSVFIAALALLWSCNALCASSDNTATTTTPTITSSSSSNSSNSRLDQALDNVTGMGTSTVTISGDLNSSCSVAGSNNICLGTYVWSDDHSNDSSVNKGAIVMTGNVQQTLVSNINVNSSVSPTATGVNTIGTVDLPNPGSTLYLTNTNNATGFLGGF